MADFEDLDLNQVMHRFSTFPKEWNLEKVLKLAKSGFYFSKMDQSVVCYFCKMKFDGLNAAENHDKKCSLTADIPIMENYRLESHRLLSFSKCTDWSAPVTPQDLAKNGFFWTGMGDNCRCFVCRLEVRGWEEGDTASGEHLRWNSSCPFMNNRDVGNVPIQEQEHKGDRESFSCFFYMGEGSCRGDQLNTMTSFSQGALEEYTLFHRCETFGDFGVKSRRKIQTSESAMFKAEYSSLERRLSSYSEWFEFMANMVGVLATAGFFYIGRCDILQCFDCGVALKDWGPLCEPWDEHAKWAPQCHFLLRERGQMFIDSVKNLEKLTRFVENGIPPGVSFSKKHDPAHNQLRFKHPLILKMALHRFFTFPNDQPSRLELANSGLYLTAEGHSVQCIFCKIKIDLNLYALELHTRCSPDCTLLKENDVPIRANNNCYQYQSHRLFSFQNARARVLESFNLAENGFYWDDNACVCFFCRVEVNEGVGIHECHNDRRFKRTIKRFNVKIGLENQLTSYQDHFTKNPFVKENHDGIIYCNTRISNSVDLGLIRVGNQFNANMIRVMDRLNTFRNETWTSNMPTEELAEAGFYYFGEDDLTYCFQCGGDLMKWDPEIHNAMEEHAQWFPNCPFVLLHK